MCKLNKLGGVQNEGPARVVVQLSVNAETDISSHFLWVMRNWHIVLQ